MKKLLSGPGAMCVLSCVRVSFPESFVFRAPLSSSPFHSVFGPSVLFISCHLCLFRWSTLDLCCPLDHQMASGNKFLLQKRVTIPVNPVFHHLRTLSHAPRLYWSSVLFFRTLASSSGLHLGLQLVTSTSCVSWIFHIFPALQQGTT